MMILIPVILFAFLWFTLRRTRDQLMGGGFLSGLPADATALEAKLARQAELRGLTRKYAADIDGVLHWATRSRARLNQLDVSEDALAGLSRRVEEMAARVGAAARDPRELLRT